MRKENPSIKKGHGHGHVPVIIEEQNPSEIEEVNKINEETNDNDSNSSNNDDSDNDSETDNNNGNNSHNYVELEDPFNGNEQRFLDDSVTPKISLFGNKSNKHSKHKNKKDKSKAKKWNNNIILDSNNEADIIPGFSFKNINLDPTLLKDIMHKSKKTNNVIDHEKVNPTSSSASLIIPGAGQVDSLFGDILNKNKSIFNDRFKQANSNIKENKPVKGDNINILDDIGRLNRFVEGKTLKDIHDKGFGELPNKEEHQVQPKVVVKKSLNDLFSMFKFRENILNKDLYFLT